MKTMSWLVVIRASFSRLMGLSGTWSESHRDLGAKLRWDWLGDWEPICPYPRAQMLDEPICSLGYAVIILINPLLV